MCGEKSRAGKGSRECQGGEAKKKMELLANMGVVSSSLLRRRGKIVHHFCTAAWQCRNLCWHADFAEMIRPFFSS